MKLPLLVSVPHAGLGIPDEVRDLVVLGLDEIARDGDVGAREIYDIGEAVDGFVTTSIARAFVDLNRAPEDRSLDGVVKTHTCWNIPIYSREPEPGRVRELLSNHYHPYHSRLEALATGGRFVLGVDCHTMAEQGPPVGPDPGQKRPHVCLGSGDGACPPNWMELLEDCFLNAFGGGVTRDVPFRGGYIVRRHCARMPWVQLEMSRAGFASDVDKRRMVLAALDEFVRRSDDTDHSI